MQSYAGFLALRPWAVVLTASALLCGCQSPDRTGTVKRPPTDKASELLGLRTCHVLPLTFDPVPGQSMCVFVPIGGQDHRVNLVPHSARAADYQVLVEGANGALAARRAGPVRTFRGTVCGRPNCVVAGALLRDGLHLMIKLEDGSRFWVEPLPKAAAAPRMYAVYTDRDVLPLAGVCQTPGADDPDPDSRAWGVSQDDSLLIARIACDTDTEFVEAQGSASAAEDRINAIINAVNVQYESQVGIRHEISTIVIRTTSDPYTSSDASQRLCQFIKEWTANRTYVNRDVAHLFSGAALSRGIIGIAADIGGTGICVEEGDCRGGRFGSFGSYCLANSEFSRGFSCVTDLTAHELGHLWGAFHCACPDNTMNPSVTCSKSFSDRSIRSIRRYRDTRDCLEREDAAVAAVDE